MIKPKLLAVIEDHFDRFSSSMTLWKRKQTEIYTLGHACHFLFIFFSFFSCYLILRLFSFLLYHEPNWEAPVSTTIRQIYWSFTDAIYQAVHRYTVLSGRGYEAISEVVLACKEECANYRKRIEFLLSSFWSQLISTTRLFVQINTSISVIYWHFPVDLICANPVLCFQIYLYG